MFQLCFCPDRQEQSSNVWRQRQECRSFRPAAHRSLGQPGRYYSTHTATHSHTHTQPHTLTHTLTHIHKPKYTRTALDQNPPHWDLAEGTKRAHGMLHKLREDQSHGPHSLRSGQGRSENERSLAAQRQPMSLDTGVYNIYIVFRSCDGHVISAAAGPATPTQERARADPVCPLRQAGGGHPLCRGEWERQEIVSYLYPLLW